MITVDQVEDSLLDLLKADAMLASHIKAWEVLTDVSEEELARAIVRFPAVGVLSDEVEYTYEMAGRVVESTRLLVLCFARNLRGAAAALRDDPSGDPGVWTLVEACRSAILSGALAVQVIDCLPVRHAKLFANEKWAVAALEVQVRWRNAV